MGETGALIHVLSHYDYECNLSEESDHGRQEGSDQDEDQARERRHPARAILPIHLGDGFLQPVGVGRHAGVDARDEGARASATERNDARQR